MKTIKHKQLRAYFVWLPVLRQDNYKAAQQRPFELIDSRTSHFWDAKRSLGWELGRLLKIPRHKRQKVSPYGYGLGWDIFLVYPPGVSWEKKPPKPVYWMHQLWGVRNAPKFKGKVLRKRVKQLLAQHGKTLGQ